MMYENIKAFIITTKVSKSKVYRFYKKNEELWSETKLKNGKRLFPTEHARYFDSEIMFDENKVSRLYDLDDQNQPIPIDDLVYQYNDIQNPNRLSKVTDHTQDPSGFSDDVADVNDSSDDYVYDDYGNMISDTNKGILNIVYNHLNLPTLIDFGNKGTIRYIYNAVGQKVRKIVIDAEENITNSFDYLDGFQYKNENLLFFPHSEGYVNCNAPKLLHQVNSSGIIEEVLVDDKNPVFSYVYNYTDHLGNIRLSYSKNPQNGQITIIEENHYYPFGLKHNNYDSDTKMFVKEQDQLKIKPVPLFFKPNYNYKYNGKEFQDELGLNMYDYGWRNYMPDIGRWGSIDNLAEKYISMSPYHYASNNPIIYFDFDGNEFTESAWDWVNRLIAEINSREEKNNSEINNLSEKINVGGTSKQIATWNKKLNNLKNDNIELEATRGEIATLESSDQKYDVEYDYNGTTVEGTTNQTYYKTSNNTVTISVSSGTDIALFSHELKHAFQFEVGQTSLCFDKKETIGFLHDAWDEVSAYRRGSLFGQHENINSPEDLPELYKDLQKGPKSIYNHQYDLTNPMVKNQLNSLALKLQLAFRINNKTYNGKN